MRLLIVSHYYPVHRGGVEQIAGQIARRLAARGFEVTWAASGPAEEVAAGITALPMRASNVTEEWFGVPYPLWGPKSLLRLWRTTRQADVVHLHDCLYLGNVVAWLAARTAHKPVVVTQHIGLVPYRSALLRLTHSVANHVLGKLVLGRSAQIVFYSDTALEYFRGVMNFKREPLRILNGVDAETFFPATSDERALLRRQFGWPASEPVLLFVGRFVEKKGMTLLQSIAEQTPDCRWVFVGWGQHDPEQWRLPHVISVGRLDHEQLARFYRAADLLVLPSVGEGFPLVIQEAMACGLPVLTSQETAAGDHVAAPLCYTAELSAAGFTQRIRELFAAPDELGARRQAVADLAHNRWSWEQTADRYAEVFRQAAGAEYNVL